MARKAEGTNPTPIQTGVTRTAAQIKALRAQIDRLDLQIVKLINERAAIAADIGRSKMEQGEDIFSPAARKRSTRTSCRPTKRTRGRCLSTPCGRSSARSCPARAPAEGLQGGLPRAGVQLQPPRRRRALRPVGRVRAGGDHCRGLRGGGPGERRIRRRADRELHRRPGGRHPGHVPAHAPPGHRRRDPPAHPPQPGGQLRAPGHPPHLLQAAGAVAVPQLAGEERPPRPVEGRVEHRHRRRVGPARTRGRGRRQPAGGGALRTTHPLLADRGLPVQRDAPLPSSATTRRARPARTRRR